MEQADQPSADYKETLRTTRESPRDGSRQSGGRDSVEVRPHPDYRQRADRAGLRSQGKESAAAAAISDAGMTLTMNSLTQQQLLQAMAPKTPGDESLGRGSIGQDSFRRDDIGADVPRGAGEKTDAAGQLVAFQRRGSRGGVATGQGAIAPGPGGPPAIAVRTLPRPAHLQQAPQFPRSEVPSPGTAALLDKLKPPLKSPQRGTPETISQNARALVSLRHKPKTGAASG